MSDWKAIALYTEHLPVAPERAAEIAAASIPANPTPEEVEKFAGMLAKLPQVQGETTHHFSDSTYTRAYHMPAHTVLVGRRHTTDHLLVILMGDVSITTNAGFQRLRAPYIEEAIAGVKRIAVAHADSIVLNVHKNPSNTRDLAQLRAELTED